MGFAVDDGDAVSVAITGPRHSSTEDEERWTGKRHRRFYMQITRAM